MLTNHQRERARHFAGCDQQGRYPEAAHAASEFDDDSDRRNDAPIHRLFLDWFRMSDGARFVFWLLMAILMVAGAWHVALRMAAA